MTHPRIAAWAAAFGAVLIASTLQAEPRRGERVSVTSCQYPGTGGPTCVMIKGPDGTVYNVSAVTPRPRSNSRMIRFRGTITDRASTCGAGIVLDRIRWTRTRLHCAN